MNAQFYFLALSLLLTIPIQSSKIGDIQLKELRKPLAVAGYSAAGLGLAGASYGLFQTSDIAHFFGEICTDIGSGLIDATSKSNNFSNLGGFFGGAIIWGGGMGSHIGGAAMKGCSVGCGLGAIYCFYKVGKELFYKNTDDETTKK